MKYITMFLLMIKSTEVRLSLDFKCNTQKPHTPLDNVFFLSHPNKLDCWMPLKKKKLFRWIDCPYHLHVYGDGGLGHQPSAPSTIHKFLPSKMNLYLIQWSNPFKLGLVIIGRVSVLWSTETDHHS